MSLSKEPKKSRWENIIGFTSKMFGVGIYNQLFINGLYKQLFLNGIVNKRNIKRNIEKNDQINQKTWENCIWHFKSFICEISLFVPGVVGWYFGFVSTKWIYYGLITEATLTLNHVYAIMAHTSNYLSLNKKIKPKNDVPTNVSEKLEPEIENLRDDETHNATDLPANNNWCKWQSIRGNNSFSVVNLEDKTIIFTFDDELNAKRFLWEIRGLTYQQFKELKADRTLIDKLKQQFFWRKMMEDLSQSN